MKIRTLIILCLLNFSNFNLFTQISQNDNSSGEYIAQGLAKDKDAYKEIFYSVEKGINDGNITLFSVYFGKQIYLDLRNSEKGFFSANQAHFILENFFSIHKPLSFSFSTHGFTDDIPFATGRGIFRFKNNKESFQIYIALTKYNGNWVIDKINFY